MKARHVIHTVGPVWRGGNHDERETLENCYRNALSIAIQHGLRSIAFPSVSTGAYGYPVPLASRLALTTVKECAEAGNAPVEVVFVLFSASDLSTYQGVANAL